MKGVKRDDGEAWSVDWRSGDRGGGADVVSASIVRERSSAREGNYSADLRAMPPVGRQARFSFQSQGARSHVGRQQVSAILVDPMADGQRRAIVCQGLSMGPDR